MALAYFVSVNLNVRDKWIKLNYLSCSILVIRCEMIWHLTKLITTEITA